MTSCPLNMYWLLIRILTGLGHLFNVISLRILFERVAPEYILDNLHSIESSHKIYFYFLLQYHFNIHLSSVKISSNLLIILIHYYYILYHALSLNSLTVLMANKPILSIPLSFYIWSISVLTKRHNYEWTHSLPIVNGNELRYTIVANPSNKHVCITIHDNVIMPLTSSIPSFISFVSFLK